MEDPSARAARKVSADGDLRGRGRRAAVAVLGAAALILAMTAAAFGASVRGGDAESGRRTEISDAARRTAVDLQSLDYTAAQPGIDKVQADLTGEARNQWATNSKHVLDALKKNQTQSTIRSVNAGVVSMDEDSAEAIVWVSTVTRTPKVKDGVTRSFRWRFDLARTDGRWLVSKLGVVPWQ